MADSQIERELQAARDALDLALKLATTIEAVKERKEKELYLAIRFIHEKNLEDEFQQWQVDRRG